MPSPDEQAQTERFAAYYGRAEAPVIRSIERSVCGCDYGGTSWTTRDEADWIGALLGLGPGLRLLDVGAGSGWPGLYLAEQSGCEVALVDLPWEGLRIAAERAAADRLPGACWAAVADGARLPFAEASFDAISHSDVLCCLPEKRAVLEACRRVIRRDGKRVGRMVFSVISVAPGLSPEDRRRGVEHGPQFVDSEDDYPTLLAETGWSVLECHDITEAFTTTLRRMLDAEVVHEEALAALIGEAALADRRNVHESRLKGTAEGLLRRELFVAAPAGAA